MKIFRNGCSCSDLTVYPSDWNQPGAFLGVDWYIQYRFTDPNAAGRYPKGKLCIVKKGINSLKTLAERRAKVKTMLADLKETLTGGFNPITNKKAKGSSLKEIGKTPTDEIAILPKHHLFRHFGRRTASLRQ